MVSSSDDGSNSKEISRSHNKEEIMTKYLVFIALVLSGCSNVTINGAMCDKIESDPNAVVPQECRAYDEAKAAKAFHKVVEKKKVSDKDIEFNSEK
jgi:hypothetical protein